MWLVPIIREKVVLVDGGPKKTPEIWTVSVQLNFVYLCSLQAYCAITVRKAGLEGSTDVTKARNHDRQMAEPAQRQRKAVAGETGNLGNAPAEVRFGEDVLRELENFVKLVGAIRKQARSRAAQSLDNESEEG